MKKWKKIQNGVELEGIIDGFPITVIVENIGKYFIIIIQGEELICEGYDKMVLSLKTLFLNNIYIPSIETFFDET